MKESFSFCEMENRTCVQREEEEKEDEQKKKKK
jgi:hypothetical protein